MIAGINFFIVKIPIHFQKLKREKLGEIIESSSKFRFMQFNLQCGEIVSAGYNARKIFPEAQEGMILIFSHLIEGNEKDPPQRLIFSDETFNYYGVKIKYETFAVYNGEKIITHPDFVLMEEIKKPKEKLDTVLWLPDEFELTENEAMYKLEELKEQVNHLMQAGLNDNTKSEILYIERQMEEISARLNEKRLLPYKIVAGPSTMPEIENKICYMLNIASRYQFEFMQVTHLRGKVEYIALTL